MRRNDELKHEFPAPADAPFATLDAAFVASLKPLIRLVGGDEEARKVLRLDEEPVEDKDKAA